MNTRKIAGHNAGSSQSGKRRKLASIMALTLGLAVSGWQSSALADARTQAKRLHDRIASVPPTDAQLNTMATLITNGDRLGAAAVATTSSSFYNVTLKNFAAPWTNRDQSVFVPLNDYTATVIGMVRDDKPFNTLLSDDILYVGNPSSGAPAYTGNSNAHYESLEARNVDLRTALQETTQSSVLGIPAAATAGIMTTRAAAEAFFIAGTNRAMFRFTLLNHLCRDLEQVQDTSRSPDRVRQDISRSPGGDSRLFLNGCVGCHSGMDPLAQAFAYYNFDPASGTIQYTPGTVQPKYLINMDNFAPGYVTPDDHWDNRWRQGHNQLLGWASGLPGAGSGAKSMGTELASSDAFAQCQVEKVFRRVCFRSPSDTADRNEVDRIVGVFRNDSYSLKRVFQEAGVYCMGQ
ncbi:MAG TPA: hypothetical protein VK629_04650 [Steroidobacteraceae bacterium]|nr:hypothetical protein [Steroidobacteraceae bacterium]